MSNGAATFKNSLAVPQVFNIDLTCNTEILFLRVCPKELKILGLHKNEYMNIHNNQKVETTQMSISWWMKVLQHIHTMEYYYHSAIKRKYRFIPQYVSDSWTLFSLKEARCKRSHIVWFYLYVMPRTRKFIEIESRLVFLKVWVKAGENGEWLPMSMWFLSGMTKYSGIR